MAKKDDILLWYWRVQWLQKSPWYYCMAGNRQSLFLQVVWSCKTVKKINHFNKKIPQNIRIYLKLSDLNSKGIYWKKTILKRKISLDMHEWIHCIVFKSTVFIQTQPRHIDTMLQKHIIFIYSSNFLAVLNDNYSGCLFRYFRG